MTNRGFLARLCASVLVVNIFVCALSGFFLVQSKRQYIHKTEIQLQNLVAALELTMSGIFNETNLILLSITDEAARHAEKGGIDSSRLSEYVAHQHSRIPDVANFQIVRANGDLIGSENGVGKVLINIAERDHFKALEHDPTLGIYFSKPLYGRINKQWILIAARRLNNRDGSFAGIVQATVSIDHLVKMFSTFDLGKNGVITLRDADLDIVARYPAVQNGSNTIGVKAVSPQLRDLVSGGHKAGTYVNSGSVDTQQRIFAFQKLGRYPFYVNAGRSLSEQLADWYGEVWKTVSLCALFLVCSLFSARLMLQKWEHIQLSKLSLEKYNERLEGEIGERTAELNSSNELLRRELQERKNIEATLIEKATLLENEMVERQKAHDALQEKTVELEEEIEERETVQLSLEEQTTFLEAEIAERTRSEEEHALLHDQFLQAHKMEAVGLLAGGIAHDFNNLLSVIMGYGELLMRELPEGKSNEHASHILQAALRAAELTKGLLAFSRKQSFNLETTDIIRLVSDNCTFLRRVIGEDIDLVTAFPATPLYLTVDRSQLQQVLMNLATNARDAMPTGGALSISISSKQLDDRFIAPFGYGKPGRYAVIQVSDNGTGMDMDTVARIFEPFFTTKEEGRGTGLGLSMIHGIIAQHNGFIRCSSEPGRGTVFTIYLPLCDAAAQAAGVDGQPGDDIPRGSETILIAEDDRMLMELTTSYLEENGYTVFQAFDGAEAVELFAQRKGEIDLVLLDAIMPKMTGKQVWDCICELRTDVKGCFVSGYTTDIINGKVGIDYSLPFISKPVFPRVLLQKIREILDGSC